MKTLYVKNITKEELERAWGFRLPEKYSVNHYIRCNSKGIVNWDKAPVYTAQELVGRGGVKIL